MKGIVFTEFLELVEDKFGLSMVDTIIEESDLPSQGVYTAVGTYDFAEMLALVSRLSEHTKIEVQTLLLVYGEHFFSVIERSYPMFLKQYSDPITMLSSIENHIHVEVQKIYPEAQLPTFEIVNKTEHSLEMIYTSSRALYNFGLGLMNKTFAYFNEEATIDHTLLKEDGTEVKFMIRQHV